MEQGQAMELNVKEIRPLVELALKEDIGGGDITSDILVTSGYKAKGIIIAEENGTIAGIPVAELVFKILDAKLKFTAYISGAFIRYCNKN
jgi:nicotinate-nucleotide pyrophosphorylase (carboxylating)